MGERRATFEFDDLLACGRGELFGQGNAQLPLPPMLMFDRISHIGEAGGAHGKGQIVAELKVAGNDRLDWFFDCHFQGDPVMPGCLGLDALWQLTGFYLGWLGAPGRGRALGVGKVEFTGMVLPSTDLVRYVVDVKRVVMRGKLNMCISDGQLLADDKKIYVAEDMRVTTFVEQAATAKP
jgi:3-hydroxyacyl-[acyl-carrier protein] dehydratase / trans-2-decenoyl-[acyl-carrier protein] isomerase